MICDCTATSPAAAYELQSAESRTAVTGAFDQDTPNFKTPPPPPQVELNDWLKDVNFFIMRSRIANK